MMGNFFFVIFILGLTSARAEEMQDLFTQRATEFTATKYFMDYFAQNLFTNSNQIEQGSELYNSLKSPGFSENGVSAVAFKLTPSQVSFYLDNWEQKGLINSEIKQDGMQILSGTSFKIIKDTLVVKPNGELVAGRIGYLKVFGDKITILYAFNKFKLGGSQVVDFVKVESEACRLWGEICNSAINLDGEPNYSLDAYFISELIKKFNEEERYKIYISGEEDRYRRFLPDEMSQAVEKIEANPDKAHDQLFDSDPFAIVA